MINNSQNKLLTKMKIDTLSATILGLITVSGYWIIILKKWLVRNQKYKESFYKTKIEDFKSSSLLDGLNKRTRTNIKIANIAGVMLIIGLVIFLIVAYAELVLHKYPIDEEYIWFYIWLTFSIFAVLLASIALQLRKTLLEEKEVFTGGDYKKPWLLSGKGKRIYVLAVLNIILALGLLPFVIFPPILSSAINGYVEMEASKISK